MATDARPVEYPSSDGNPIADNTLQFEWIVTLQGGVADLYTDTPDVFVAGDNLIYPVEGDPRTRIAPDVYVAFGRPKGHRGSYQVWNEAGIFPQVVFEVMSPGNRAGEMRRKLAFYSGHGAEEYYVYDPDRVRLLAYARPPGGGPLAAVPDADGFVSPRLGIRFDLSGGDLVVYRPDGARFRTFLEITADERRAAARADDQARRANQETARADQEAARAEQAVVRAERAVVRAERAVVQAEQAVVRADEQTRRADEERTAREAAEARATREAADNARLRDLLKAAGLDPERAS